MKAKPTMEAVLAKLSKEDQKVVINYAHNALEEEREAVGLRLYYAAACAAFDMLNLNGDELDDFVIALDQIVSGHCDEVYNGRSGNIDDMAIDMRQYLNGEGCECKVLEKLFESYMRKRGRYELLS